MFSNANTDLNQKLDESINSSAPLRQLFEENNNLKTAINNYDYNSRALSLASEGLSTPMLELLIPILKHLELETLNLYSNQLETLPDSIGGLTKLETLNLDSNKLQTLPESIGELTSLNFLSIRNNRLQTLPESIGGFNNIDIYAQLDRNKKFHNFSIFRLGKNNKTNERNLQSWEGPNSERQFIRPGISYAAMSYSLRPKSAREGSATL
jgi:Leucine-rich repeat (LRR) protein